MDDIVIIIPSYKPDKEIMMEFLKTVKQNFKNIVVVNDGSGEEYTEFFKKIEDDGIPVLLHYINFGKGRAIKTAFNYVLNNYKDIVGSITADCDGQHHIDDIIKCAEKLKQDNSKMIIGSRNFNESQVPARSRFGNKLTRLIFSAFVGLKITDTQSGLRAFGVESMTEFVDVYGERYEYETNVLIECKEKNIKIDEVPISTIYINNNSLSHFNPIRDSFIIYKLFIKYIISALSSFAVDILLFTLFVKLLPTIQVWKITEIVVATVLARIISSIFNFILNAKVVFKNQSTKSIIKYIILVIVQMLVSAFAVSELFLILNINATAIKFIVDIIIFIVNFVVQREWVFK